MKKKKKPYMSSRILTKIISEFKTFSLGVVFYKKSLPVAYYHQFFGSLFHFPFTFYYLEERRKKPSILFY